MKLVFKKDKDSQISVLHKIKDKEKEFSYVEMIKDLIETKKMEDPDISDGFSEEEIKSIKSMVTFINKEIVAEKDKKEDINVEETGWEENDSIEDVKWDE